MLPSAERKEWLKLVSGEINPVISSHLFRIRLTNIRNKIKRNQISTKEGVRELIADCQAHQDIYQSDLHKIFSKENAQSV